MAREDARQLPGGPAARLRSELEEARARADALATRVAMLEAQLAAERRVSGSSTSERMSALLAICAALLITHEVDTILRLTVRDSARLFPGVSAALLFLSDDDGQSIALRASSPAPPVPIRLLPGQGVAGRAFLAPRAMLMAGPELEMAIEELAPEQQAIVQRLIPNWPPTGALLAPLRVENNRLGALVLYGSTHAHLLHPRDLPFAQALADLTAVAIGEQQATYRAAALQRDLDQSQSRLDAAQAQLLQSAKLAAVGELAASVAHEINNPLYAARNSLYLVEQDLPPDAPMRQFLAIAQSELGRIARIITRMRDFYRPARNELETVEVGQLLSETIELVQTHLRHGSVTVEVDLADDLPGLTAHADQLRQVFLNLMLNACDAMPDGGRLRVATRLGRMPEGAEPAGDAIEVEVSDTGAGISEEHLPHLFEPFYTTKPHGTGLGLAISAHIVTQHGGRIDVRSAVGQGSTFTVTLPVQGG